MRKNERSCGKKLSAPVIALLLTIGTTAVAHADQAYAVSGSDRYQLASSGKQLVTSYSGSENLAVRHTQNRTVFVAHVRYVKTGETGIQHVTGSFAQTSTAAGDLRDLSNGDPDSLTVLNQPFAVEIDKATLSELMHATAPVMYKFQAPITGSTVRGYLRRGPIRIVNSRPALSVTFDATGPVNGSLSQEGEAMAGTVRMVGTAYYALQGDPLLVAIDETLTVAALLRDHDGMASVTIVHRRSIKAAGPIVMLSLSKHP